MSSIPIELHTKTPKVATLTNLLL